MADINEVRADFSKTKALAQKLIDEVDAAIAQAIAAKDDIEVARLSAKRGELGKLSEGTRQAPQIQQDTAALERENAVRQAGLQTERATLTAIQEQAAVLSRMRTLQRPGGAYLLSAGGATAAGLREQQEVERAMESERNDAISRGLQMEKARLTLLEQQASAAHAMDVALKTADAESLGAARGARGRALSGADYKTINEGAGAGAIAGQFTAEERALLGVNAELGNYRGLMSRAGMSTQALGGNLIRLSLVQSEASTQMRKHGALTTEFLSALGRGETTVAEFGYQLGATIQKFAGWTAAAAATYGALGIVTEIGKGAIDGANAVGNLRRTIDGLNSAQASQAVRDLSQNTATSMKESGDAVFAFSRTFHNVSDAAGAARYGVGALTLDNVKLADSVRLVTLVHQQFGYNVQQLGGFFDVLSSAQRVYNARLSDMIPLLNTSIGAVRNAGGDLNQLAAIGTLAQRATGLAGARVGTGIYRSASNVAVQNASVLERQYGLPDPQKNYTQFLIDAINKGATLNRADRTALSVEIFGKQFGGRFASLFTPQSAATLRRELGGKDALTPANQRGAFDKELATQIATARKQLDQFVYGLQRLGSALGASGALAPLGLLIKGADDLINVLTHLTEGFGALPSLLKDIVEGVLAFKAASAFLTGSRFGRSVQQLPGIRGVTGLIPGLHATDTQIRDQQLTEGTRSGLTAYQDIIARQTAQLKAIAVEQNTLNAQAEAITAQLEREDLTTKQRRDLLRTRNQLEAEINAKNDEALALEAELNAQQAARNDLQTQLVGLTTRRRSLQLSEGSKQALANSMGLEAAAANAAAGEASFSQAAGQRMAAGKARLAQRLRRDAVATEEAGAATGKAGAAAEADAVAADTAAIKAETGTTLLQGAGNSLSRLGTRLGDLAAAIDPLLVGLVGIPLVISAIRKNEHDAAAAVQAFHAAGKQRPDDLASLNAQAQALTAAEKKAGQAASETSPGSSVQNPVGPRLANLARLYQQYAREFARDLPELVKTDKGRQEIYQQSQRLKQIAAIDARSSLAGFPQLINDAQRAFAQALQDGYTRAIRNAPALKSDPFAAFENESAKQIAQQLQASEDRAKIFGTSGGDLRQAALGYTFLANKYRNSQDSTTLQQIASAQGNFVNAVNKNVQDLLHAAQSGTTYGAETSSLNQALGVIERARQVEQNALDAIIKRDKGNAAAIKKAREAADQVFAQLNDSLKTVLQQQLQTIQARTDLRVSQITGISPESDIARARETLAGLREELAKAQAEHADFLTIAGLQRQINDQINAIFKQTASNADAIAQAQGQLYISAVTGTGPAADLERARRGITVAQGNLARDRHEGKGQAAILADQAAVNDALRTYNQQVQQDAQQLHQNFAAYIQSQSDLAQSQTLDPIKQAQEQLKADIRVLSTIHRSDYQSNIEYLTALNQQRAKINKDRQGINDQIVQTDLSTLAFESHIQKIGDQQYISALQNILKTKKLSLATRQQILSTIYDLQHGQGQNLDLNVGSIKFPSVYQIRRAIGLGQRGELPGAQNTVINHSAVVNVYVRDTHGAVAVGRVLDHHLGTSVRSAMRAKGVIG